MACIYKITLNKVLIVILDQVNMFLVWIILYRKTLEPICDFWRPKMVFDQPDQGSFWAHCLMGVPKEKRKMN